MKSLFYDFYQTRFLVTKHLKKKLKAWVRLWANMIINIFLRKDNGMLELADTNTAGMLLALFEMHDLGMAFIWF